MWVLKIVKISFQVHRKVDTLVPSATIDKSQTNYRDIFFSIQCNIISCCDNTWFMVYVMNDVLQ